MSPDLYNRGRKIDWSINWQVSPIHDHLQFRSTSSWRAGLAEADRALSELAGSVWTLPNPHLLIGPFVRRESVLSSRLEGTPASLPDLLFFEATSLREKEVPLA